MPLCCAFLKTFFGESMSGSLKVQSSEAKQVRADLALMISTGDDTDSFNEDMQIYNGSTGTRFETLFNIVGKVLQGNGNLEAHSCRQSCTTGNEDAGGVTNIPPCVPVRDLHEKSEKRFLEEDVTSEDVTYLSTLYLSFVPSNEWNAVSSCCFGWIPVKRGITKSSGRAFGLGSHYNAKLWQHVI